MKPKEKMPTCQLQEQCHKYDSGDNKPSNHQVRVSVPCIHFLQSNCSMYLEWMYWQDEEIACDIKKRITE